MKKQKITCEKARNISIVKILEKFGHFPKKKSEKEAWFLNPYRSETQASFKVSLSLNRWYDHGQGKGGNIIDLIMLLNKCSVSEALSFLNNDIDHFSFHQQLPKKFTPEKNYEIMEIKELKHKALIDYLISRKINVTISKKYCQEIHYKMNSKNFFAIGFKNDNNGYEIRNKYIKGNLINKNITTINNSAKSVCVFEGFMDFLSYEVIFKNKNFNMDFIILNSISNVKNILQKIKKYDKIFCYLDNDSPGIEATSILLNSHKGCLDFSFMYDGFNDLNEYLIKDQIGAQRDG